jgi:hypothetical protein
VAIPAADRLQAFRVRELFNSGIGMAGGAFEILMDGPREYFHVNKEGNLLACALCGQRRGRMAFETRLIALCCDRKEAADENDCCEEQKSIHSSPWLSHCTFDEMRKQ